MTSGTSLVSQVIPDRNVRPFLTAEWRNLVMLNYEVEPELLRGLVPRGTELDSWSGRTFVSLVGFLFARTRVLRVPVPFHQTFEEVNLRFYVRRTVHDEVRRGVSFIKELVPRILVARLAQLTYNEPYAAVPMRHRYDSPTAQGVPALVEYGWRLANEWTHMRIAPVGTGVAAAVGSEKAFITEHYWGYTRQRDGSTVEYQVVHPRWRVWSAGSIQLSGNVAATYGPVFGSILTAPPSSAFLADGSAIVVGRPMALSDGNRP